MTFMGVSVNSNAKLVQDRLGRIVTQIPKVSKAQTKLIAETFAKSMKAGAPTWKESASSLTIKNSIKVEETEKGYGVALVEHGFLLDAMEYHAAPSGFGDTKNPVMKSWLEQKRPGYELPYIWVSPTPWITESVADGSAAIREYVKSGKTELAKFLKSLKAR